MSAISLKINVVKLGSVKMIKFQGDMTVQEVCRDIRDKLGEEGGGSDHGLFWPDQGKWLEPKRTLDFYDLKSGDLLEYKKKHRPLRVKMMDDTVKTILIDDSLSVQELVKVVCQRIGITNPDEFSFTTEKLEESKRAARAEAAKKKEAVADKTLDTVWLNPDKSLREQGVDENEMILLKKKFFFSDQNIDRNDPIQLNLLYVQAQEAIVKGVHPCTFEEACQFAALQLQVQFGNHEPDKHKQGFINLDTILPPDYAKQKGEAEKKIFQEHRKLQGMTELNAKFRYVQLCRSLKTYGVTFFTVKEKVAKKNKMVKILLGVTRDSVMRLDAETKEVLKVWPLTTLRRWAASPNSFTLDFGDYSENYYSVQTAEGDSISQLIAGYIDIIIKKKKDADRLLQEEDTELAITEDNVEAYQGTAISVVPGKAGQSSMVDVAQSGLVQNPEGMGMGNLQMSRQGMQYMNVGNAMGAAGMPGSRLGAADMSGASQAQQALLQNINNGFASVNAATSDLNVATTLPPLGNDPASVQWRKQTMDISKQNVQSQVASHLAATAGVVNLTSVDPKDMDYAAISTHISTMSTNLTQLASGAKMIAALMEDQSEADKLLEAARKLAAATQKMLTAAQPAVVGQGNRQDLLAAAQGIGASGAQLLRHMGDPDVSLAAQQELIELAKQVAVAMTEAVQHAKTVAGATPDPKNQQEVIAATKNSAASAAQLVTTTNVVAPTINSPLCQDQLVESANQVETAVGALVNKGKLNCTDKQAIADLSLASDKVKAALQKLIDKARQGGTEDSDLNNIDRHSEVVFAATQALIDSLGNAGAIVSSAKQLALASTQLVNALKAQAATELDPNEKARLLAAARALADATTKMVNAAKDAARNPNDPQVQARLRAAAEALAQATRQAAGADNRRKAFKKLALAGKGQAAAATQLIAAAKAASPSNRNQASQMQLINASKGTAEQTGQLVTAVRAFNENPEDAVAQLKLINAAKSVLVPGQTMVAAAKAANPTIGDQAVQTQLLNFTKATNDSLRKLKDAIDAAEAVSGSLELDSALETVSQARSDLQKAKVSAKKGELKPTPDQTPETCMLEITANAKGIGSSMAQLISAASQGQEGYTGVAARDTAQALQSLSSAVRGVAATSSDRDLQDQTIDTATEVMDRSDKLIRVARAALENPGDPDNQNKLANAATDVNKAMAQLVDCLPGQRDVTRAIANMQKNVVRIGDIQPKQPGETFQSAQNKLSTTAAAVTVASNNLVNAAKGTPQQLKTAAEQLDMAFNNLVNAGLLLSSQSGDPKMQAEIAAYVNETFTSITRLLQASKAFNADPNGTNLKNLLTVAAKGVADSINKLLSLCSAAAPGQKECNNALQTLDLALSKLENVNEPNMDNDDPYLTAVKKIAEQQSVVSGLFVAIPHAARAGDPQSIGNGVVKVADSIFAMTDAAARAVYLIGVSDDSSVAAVPGLIDLSKVSQAVSDIEESCAKLQDRANKQQQVLAAASVIAKNTSALCTYCKTASSKTSNPIAKNQFVQSAKTVATTTSALVTNIKALATNTNDEAARNACAASSQPLVDAIQNLRTFAASPEFAATSAYVSPIAQKYQAPIVKQGHDVISSAKDLVGTVKTLCGNPSDADTVQLFNAQAKAINDMIKGLVSSIKSNAPGQKECDMAIEKISTDIVSLDAALIKSAAHDLKPENGPDFGGYRDMLLNNIHAVQSTLDIISKSAKADPESLGQAVNQLVQNFAPLTQNGIGAASRTNDTSAQTQTLELAKAIAEQALEMIYATKATGTNPDAASAQQKLDQTIAKVNSSLKNMTTHLEGASDETGEMNQIISDLARAMDTLDSEEDAPTDLSYQGYADEINTVGKDLASTMTDIVAKAREPDELPALAAVVGEKYGRLVRSARGAAATAGEDEVKQSVLESVRALGGSNVRLLDSMKGAVSNPHDPSNRGRIANAARDVSQNVAKMLISVKNGSKGLLMCQQAIEAINDVIADLETAIVFAAAGQLDPVDRGDNFNNYKETILTGTKDLTNDVKGLVAGSTASQDMLAAAANSSVSTIVGLKDSIKAAAASITSADRNGQEQLLTATKNVATKLQSHIEASMRASSRQPNDINNLRESAKNMVAAISELLRVVKTVGDDASRALRALESANAGVAEAIQTLDSSEAAMGTALPADVVTSAKAVAAAAAQLVTASNTSQDDVITAAGQARATIEDLVRVGKASTENAPADLRTNMHTSVRNTAQSMSKLLNVVKTLQTASTPANKENVKTGAKTVAEAVNKVVEAAGKLIPSGYVDPNDPNVIAERELLAAASSIEAAARKLAALQPAERPREADEDLPFEAQILEAAKAIAAATAALVRSATFTQREIVASGKSGPQEDAMYFNDGTWSEGLVSAAKAVASSTGELCDAANEAVQGKADRERVIVSAKGVSASTAQLLSAATVKTDPNSESVTRLRAAGTTVTRATKNLVQAAESTMAFDDSEAIVLDQMKSGVGAKKAEMETQMDIIRMERQLEMARKKLAGMRKGHYQK